ncbi:MAG: nucleotide pyrophosphatase/phosphodiesterase family protein [Acidobacteriota bacterium]
MRRPLVLLLPLLLLAACRTAVPSTTASGHGRVVVFSLDAADSVTLHRLYQEGKLDAGGFARFFRDGQVADGLQPVNPAMTAVNHIAIATGHPPDETGIVANDFLPPGAPLGRTVSGFAAPIGTETLWEAARRQGLRVATFGWPGADGSGERRRADWGLIYTGDPTVPARVVDLAWSPGLPKAGEWGAVPCGEGICRVKTLEIAPDGSTARVFFNGTFALHAYPEAFEAELHRQGLVWPGPPEGDLLLKSWWGGGAGIDLETWMEQTERFQTFFAEALLSMARFGEWDLLMGYTPVLDDAGHQLLLTDPRQPGYWPERRDELDRARTRIWQAVDRDLARLLAAFDLRTTTFLVVSDHGMAPTHTVLDPDLLFRNWGFQTLDGEGRPDASSRAAAVGQGGLCHVYVRADLPDRDRVLDDLRSRFLAWKVGDESPIARVLTRAESAEIGLDHPNSGDLILLAAPGYHFRSLDDPAGAGPASPSFRDYGKHGYLATDRAMQAVYLAVGRGVKPGRRGTVRNLDLAAEIAAWLGIEPPRRRPTAP